MRLALLLAQFIVGRRDIEQQQVLAPGGLGDFGNNGSRGVDQKEAHAFLVQFRDGLDQSLSVWSLHAFQREINSYGFAREGALAHGNLGAGKRLPERLRQVAKIDACLVVTRIVFDFQIGNLERRRPSGWSRQCQDGQGENEANDLVRVHGRAFISRRPPRRREPGRPAPTAAPCALPCR